jgi:class 3 adenylate cyclase
MQTTIADATSPRSVRLIIAVADITGFAKACALRSDRLTFEWLAEFYEFVGDVVGSAGGRVVKFMGDAALNIFTADAARPAIALQEQAMELLSRLDSNCHLHIKAHVGDLECGPLGVAAEKRFDVVGQAMFDLFRTPSGEFTVSTDLQTLLDANSPSRSS